MSQPGELSMRVVTAAAPVRTQVVESLRRAITDGRLAPGRRLVEKDLCQMLGVSRPSVREALRALEAEGLISSIPHRGPVVTELTAQDAAAIYQVRGALESLAAELFAAHASQADIDALEAATQALEAAYEAGELGPLLAAKRAFYEALFQGSGNMIIAEVLRTMNARITRLRAVGLASAERRAESRREIRTLVEALKRRDAAAAATASRRHVERAAETALASLAG